MSGLDITRLLGIRGGVLNACNRKSKVASRQEGSWSVCDKGASALGIKKRLENGYAASRRI